MINTQQLAKLVPLAGLAEAAETLPQIIEGADSGDLYRSFIGPFDNLMHDDEGRDSLRREGAIGHSTLQLTAEHKAGRGDHHGETFRRYRRIALELPSISCSIHVRTHTWQREGIDDPSIIEPKVAGSLVGPPSPPAIAELLGIDEEIAQSDKWKKPPSKPWIAASTLEDGAKIAIGFVICVAELVTSDMLEEKPVADDDYYFLR
jgi:hypothetical protein